MKLKLCLWLMLAACTSPASNVDMDGFQLHESEDSNPEERSLVPRLRLDSVMESLDDSAADIVALKFTAIEGVSAIAKIDYSQSPGQVAWEVAEAVVPIIGAALSFIPGIGPIASGLFFGVWSIVSPMFAPQTDNPLETMIKDVEKRIRAAVDDKLSSIIKRAIYGEISRNTYICKKYSFISQAFAEEFKSNTTLNVTDANSIQMFLNDCDNFLKDTAEAFVYPEYADVLWVPSAMTTFTRLGFLAEIIKNWRLTRMMQKMVPVYFKELQDDTERQFELFFKGIEKVHASIPIDTYYDYKNYAHLKYDFLKDVSTAERASCKLQAQLLYFDRQLYPYGTPIILNNTDMFAEVKMSDYYDHYGADNRSKRKHIQIFFNVTDTSFPSHLPDRENWNKYTSMEYLNCFLGPTNLRSPDTFWFNFHAMPYGNQLYSYEFRIMYLETRPLLKYRFHHHFDYELTVPILNIVNKESTKFDSYKNIHEKLSNKALGNDPTFLNIQFVPPGNERYNESKKLVDVPGWTHWKKCPFAQTKSYACQLFLKMFLGRFKMYSAGVFSHTDEDLKTLIAIDDPRIHKRGEQPLTNGYLLGMEIILRPYMK